MAEATPTGNSPVESPSKAGQPLPPKPGTVTGPTSVDRSSQYLRRPAQGSRGK